MKAYTFLLLILLAACVKEDHKPVAPEGAAPGPVANTAVQNLPGAAKITYSLPPDDQVLYVKAVYEHQPGKKREVKSSYYNNFLVVDGFGDTTSHNVELFVVSRSEVHSIPVTVSIKPHMAPVRLVRKSLQVREDFGGINVSFTNETKAELAIITVTPDSAGNMTAVDTRYTKAPADAYSIRGYEAEKRLFGVYVRDQWGNVSDTLLQEYTPIYERLLDKSKFREVLLPTDQPFGWGLPISGLWNGTMWHSNDKLDGMPMWITFDMGVIAQLSRIALWQRPGEWLYLQNNLRKFEIWGIAGTPPANGSWDGWTKLVEHTVVKPSGLPLGQLSQEDRDKGAAGEHMDVPITAPKVRYIRLKILRTWTDGGYAANVQEMRFWGNDK